MSEEERSIVVEALTADSDYEVLEAATTALAETYFKDKYFLQWSGADTLERVKGSIRAHIHDTFRYNSGGGLTARFIGDAPKTVRGALMWYNPGSGPSKGFLDRHQEQLLSANQEWQRGELARAAKESNEVGGPTDECTLSLITVSDDDNDSQTKLATELLKVFKDGARLIEAKSSLVTTSQKLADGFFSKAGFTKGQPVKFEYPDHSSGTFFPMSDEADLSQSAGSAAE